MLKKGPRTSANLMMLEFVSKKLGQLKNKFIFVGGCTTALFMTDPAFLEVRPTIDVDCIVDVLSLNGYYQIEKQLSKQGFKKSIEDSVICRWRCEDIILDVVPTDKKILGFGNIWYKDAIKHTKKYQVSNDTYVEAITPPYFVATKLEAFKTRGNNDYLASHDFEDIINTIDGCSELFDEIKLVNTSLKKYLAKAFADMLENTEFHIALPGHLNYGDITDTRIQVLLEKMEKIVNLTRSKVT